MDTKKILVSEIENENGGSFSYTDQNGKILMSIKKPWGKIGTQRQTQLPS